MKLVILGRDGVINVAPATYVDAPENWEPLPGSLEAIARLHRDGYRVVIVTHQPAVAHGALHMEALNRIHARMLDLIRHKGGEVEAIFRMSARAGEPLPLPAAAARVCSRSLPSDSRSTCRAWRWSSADEEIAAARAAGAQPVRIAPNGHRWRTACRYSTACGSSAMRCSPDVSAALTWRKTAPGYSALPPSVHEASFTVASVAFPAVQCRHVRLGDDHACCRC